MFEYYQVSLYLIKEKRVCTMTHTADRLFTVQHSTAIDCDKHKGSQAAFSLLTTLSTHYVLQSVVTEHNRLLD